MANENRGQKPTPQRGRKAACVAERYFEDGTIKLACPPLYALLRVMAHGRHQGKDLGHPEIRAEEPRHSQRAGLCQVAEGTLGVQPL